MMISKQYRQPRHFLRLTLLALLFPVICSSTPPGRILGRVTDAGPGQALAGVTVWIEPLKIGTVTDSSGSFILEEIPPGSYRLRGRIMGYSEESRVVELESAQTFSLSLALSPVSYRLKDMLVTAEREKVSAAERSQAFVTVIRAEEFEDKAVSLPEVLSGTAGVQLKTLGGLGSYSTVSLRGTSAEQVRIYLDDVPLNNALGGGVNLASIPLSNVERVEVYRGTIPAEFGGSGLGGVVHIVTKKAKPRALDFGLNSGTFGTRQGSLFLTQKHRDWDYLAAVDYTQSDNDFRFLDDNATQYNTADDQWERRQNNGFQAANLVGKVNWRPSSQTELSVNDNFSWSNKGIANRGSFQSKFARLRETRNLIQLSLLRRGFLKYGWTLGLKGFNTYSASDYRDLKAEVSIGRQDNHNVTQTYGGETTLKSMIGQCQVWSLLLSWRQESFLPSDRLHLEQLYESKRWCYSLAVEDEVIFPGEKLSCIFSLRQESYASRFYGDYAYGNWVPAPTKKRVYRPVSHRLGAKYEIFNWLLIKGNVGRYYRMPSFYELFGDRGATIGNTELEPERGVNRDIGFRASSGPVGAVGESALEMAYFDNRLDNLIQFIQQSQMAFRPENIGKTHVRGLEIMGMTELLNLLKLEGNLTYQQALNRSDIYGGVYSGKLLPNKAEWEGQLRIALSAGGRGEIFYDYSYTDKSFHDLYNQVPIARRIIHNIGFTVVSPWQGLRATFEAKNITDNQVADMWGYPLPGRSYYVNLAGRL